MRARVWVTVGALALLVASCGGEGTGYDASGDPLSGEQYAIAQHNMESAWQNSSGAGVVIAIVDTGIDLDHPDLAARIVPGFDWVDGDDTPNDENGHGTHVAGSAAAIGNNNVGVIGMAPEASIMPLKVLSAEGTGSTEHVAEAIVWAADNGAHVINLSLGGSSDLLGRLFNKESPVNDAIIYADSKGVVVVAAAGNDDTFLVSYDQDTPVLVVNATNEFGEWARFSNFGDPRAVAAAGARILSTAPTYPTTIWPDGSEGYEEISGTSMASPHVAGIAALLVGAGERSSDDVRDTLISTASNPEDDPLLGAGIVQADSAVNRSFTSGVLFILLMAGVVVALLLFFRRRIPR